MEVTVGQTLSKAAGMENTLKEKAVQADLGVLLQVSAEVGCCHTLSFK